VNLRLSVHGRRESRPLSRFGTCPSPCATWIIAPAQGWRLLHDNESGALEVPHDPVGDNRSHVLIRVVDTLPAAEQQGESDRAGNVARVGGAELLIVGHRRTIADG
jgi:hypothetical protein